MFFIINVSKTRKNYYIIGGLCALVLMGCSNTASQSSVTTTTSKQTIAAATTAKSSETSNVAKSETETSSNTKESVTTSQAAVEKPVTVTPIVARPQIEPATAVPTVLSPVPVTAAIKADETSQAVSKVAKESSSTSPAPATSQSTTAATTTTSSTTTTTTVLQTTVAETTTVKETKPAIVTAPARQLPYYSQNGQSYSQLQYGNYTLGATGCVPASLAMAISHLNGYTVSPVDVADYLYEQTNQFNKLFVGTSGIGVSSALAHWGHSAQLITSLEQLTSELQNGRLVYAAVQGGYFTPYGTHAVILTGYDANGYTTVYNPNSSYGVQKMPVSRVWENQSWDKDDRALGTPILAIY